MPAPILRPLLGTDFFADSFGYLNDSSEAVRGSHWGPTAPTSLAPYILWADTTAGLLKQRNAANDAWIAVGILGQTNWGLLSRAGGTMTGPIDMGGFGVTNLPAGTGNAAARQTEVDAKAPIASPVLTGDAKVSQDPVGNDSIPRRSWTEGRYAKLTGSTMTGPLVMSAPAVASLEPVTYDQLKTFVLFSTTTGHRHDGSSSRRIMATDVSSFGEAAGRQLQATAGGLCSWFTPPTPGVIILASGGTKTISADAITIDQSGSRFLVLTEAAASTDNLKTIDGGVDGHVIILRATVGRTVVVKDSAVGGNISLDNGDFTMDSDDDRIELIFEGSLWYQISRASNA